MDKLITIELTPHEAHILYDVLVMATRVATPAPNQFDHVDNLQTAIRSGTCNFLNLLPEIDPGRSFL